MQFVVAFAVAYAATFSDLWFSAYPRTPDFLVRVWQAHFLSAIYGLIACALLFAFDLLVAPAVLQSEDADESYLLQFLEFLKANSTVKAIFVGLFSNGLANLKFFSIPTSGGSVPIGFQTFTQLFDPSLRDDIVIGIDGLIGEFGASQLVALGKTDSDLQQLRDTLIRAVPAKLARAAAIKVDLNNATTALELIKVGIDRLGRQWMTRNLS
jgi:hypothetical protein